MLRVDDVHAVKLIMEAANVQYVPGLHHCIADYDSHDCLRGGVILADYWGGSVMMHIAGFRPNWASKALLWAGFDYPFNHLKVKKIFGLVPEYNWRARNLDLHLGFRIECLLSDVFNHQDAPNGMYIMSMTRDECKWLSMPMPKIEFADQRCPIPPLAVMQVAGSA
jgi:hypothetical protein